jgi:AmiR/NasT family two-component response regulator
MADAMRSRAVIEQAKGMLMADQRIDADQAFERLTQLSQRSNMKLRDIAQRIVTERTEPSDG